MPQPPGTPDAPSWHKYFAATGNNRAWESSTMARTPEQDQAMLDAAHAAAWHWQDTGTELHRMRAMMLLAEVHAFLGLGTSVARYAQHMVVFFTRRAMFAETLAHVPAA